MLIPTPSHRNKIIVIVAAASALSGGIAVAAAPTRPEGPARPSAVTPQASTAAVVTQNGYVPLTPCRIVDTRKAGGALSGGHGRTFDVAGTTGFLPQGGTSGGCGVPAGAASAALSVTTTASAGSGYLTLYAHGTARPATNQTSYGKGQTVTTSVTASLRAADGLLDVYSASTTHLVVDVVGYYRAPIVVAVRGDGSIASRSRQVTSVTRTNTGFYTITFDQSIEGCATLGSAYTSYDNVGLSAYNETNLQVYVRNVTVSPTTYADDSFSVSVVC